MNLRDKRNDVVLVWMYAYCLLQNKMCMLHDILYMYIIHVHAYMYNIHVYMHTNIFTNLF